MKTRLADCCRLITDGTHYTPPDSGDGLPFLAVKDLTNDGLNFGTCSRISRSDFAAARAANAAPERGDVLFSKDGTVGKVHVVRDEGEFAVLSSVAILRPDPAVLEPQFLGWILRVPDVLDQALKRRTGSAIRRIVLKDLRLVEIPLPPLPEQRRIAAILDAADALRAKRRATIAALDTLTQSIFLDMFGDPVTNPHGLRRRALGGWGAVTTGTTPPRADAGNYGPGIEWLKSDNLSSCGSIASRASETLTLAGERRARVVPAGSILVTCIAGSPTSIGNCALVDRRVAFNQQINALTPSVADPHFLLAQLRIGKRLIQDKSTGAMKGLVSKSSFAAVELLDPPQSEQERFGGTMRSILALQDVAILAERRAHEMFYAAQAQAFRGEL